MNDKLYSTAKFYEMFLLDKTFHLVAGDKKRNKIEFDIVFREEHFNHLIGFQKLLDISESQVHGYKLLENILNCNITYSYLEKSEYFSDIENRIDNFLEMRETLFSKKLMLGKTHKFSFRTIKADFLLTKEGDYGLVNLFLKEDKHALTVPVTFFTTEGMDYNDVKSWTILDIKELDNKDNKIKSLSEKELISTNILVRSGKKDKSVLEKAFFIYNKEMYRIESIDVNIELGIDSAIISKVDNNNEEKFFEENFASQPKLKLSLIPIKECLDEEE